MQLARTMAEAFDLGGGILEVRPYGHGLINDTFVVTTDIGRRAIVQRLNPRAFPRPELILENLRTLAGHLARSPAGGGRELKLPGLLRTRDGKDLVVDARGGCWRALEFIEHTRTIESITGLVQAEEVGWALGRFHARVHDLDPKCLHETRPGFHNTLRFLQRFDEALRAATTAHSTELDHCLSFVEARRDLARVLETARHDGRLPVRPIHGDPKLDNFLFDEATARVVSLIDLDTFQPGLVHYDIGDCLRSCGNPAGESPKDVAEVRFDLDICRAILKGYLSEARGFLAPPDYRYLYDAIRLIPFELGLRFLTDHLEGDVYFKIDRPGQNLHRAVVQFRLAEGIEENERRIRALVADLTGK